jgi:predicted Zn-dependent protease
MTSMQQRRATQQKARDLRLRSASSRLCLTLSRAHVLRIAAAAGLLLPAMCTPALLADSVVASISAPPSTTLATPPTTTARDRVDDSVAHGDYPTALRELDGLLAAAPTDAGLLYERGFVHEALNDDAAAELDYRASLKSGATDFEPRLALGLLLARAGKDAEARTQLTDAVTTSKPPTDPLLKARAYRALARLNAQSAPADANDDLLAALKISPETPDDRLLSAELAQRLGETADAEAAFRSVLAATPGDAEATAGLAKILLRQEKPAEAQPLLEAALAKHPGDPILSASLASALVAQGHPDKAVPLIVPLHAAHPENAALTRLLARLDVQAGNNAAAAPLYADLVKVNPNDPGLLDDYAFTLIELLRGPEARPLLERAVAMGPAAFKTKQDYGAAASHLAFVASEQKDAEACLRALALRATVLPETPSSLFLAATAHDRLHQKSQAIVLYRQFLQAAAGKFPDQEFQARGRLVALAH